MELNKYTLNEIENYKVLGRTANERCPLTLFWTGAGLELNVQASELWVEITADYLVFEPWVDILINDALIQRFMVTKGTHKICVFRNMDPSVAKKVEIIRDTQAMSQDTDTLLQINAVYTDGSFLPTTKYDLKMEFIGDSITSGEGCSGSMIEQEWLPSWMSAISNYSYITARRLNAEYRCISQGGWGFYKSWDGLTEHSIPQHYEQICSLVDGPKNTEAGSMGKWDFASWQPDVIILNLGTNDGTALKVAERTAENIDEEYQNDVAAMKDAGIRFLKKIRSCNPDARIIWAYGIMGNQMKSNILDIIAAYQNESGDQKIQFLELEDTSVTGYGSHAHPGPRCHENAAETISRAVLEILK